MPAVLIELSFLSNPDEAHRLADAHYRDALADAVATAVANAGSAEPRRP
jgi:N-acetylmuramoyl-L-alanine amidase